MAKDPAATEQKMIHGPNGMLTETMVTGAMTRIGILGVHRDGVSKHLGGLKMTNGRKTSGKLTKLGGQRSGKRQKTLSTRKISRTPRQAKARAQKALAQRHSIEVRTF
jgi:hypothetical protein